MEEDALVDLPVVGHFMRLPHVVMDSYSNVLLLRHLAHHMNHILDNVFGTILNASHIELQSFIYDVFAQA